MPRKAMTNNPNCSLPNTGKTPELAVVPACERGSLLLRAMALDSNETKRKLTTTTSKRVQTRIAVRVKLTQTQVTLTTATWKRSFGVCRRKMNNFRTKFVPFKVGYLGLRRHQGGEDQSENLPQPFKRFLVQLRSVVAERPSLPIKRLPNRDPPGCR
jgi:hypothetical protein